VTRWSAEMQVISSLATGRPTERWLQRRSQTESGLQGDGARH
jgi:hypothetical protein